MTVRCFYAFSAACAKPAKLLVLFLGNHAQHGNAEQRVVHMLVDVRNQRESGAVSLCSAVFCLDCEVISNGRGDECPACKSRSLVNLARILGGSLRAGNSEPGADIGSFDITLTIEMHQMKASDVNTTLEGLTRVIGPRLAKGRASLHVNVQTTAANSSQRVA